LSTHTEVGVPSAEDIGYVTSVFPEIGDIADARLRDQVATIWIECWRESNWERIEDAPKNPANLGPERRLYQHVRGVTQQAVATAAIVESLHGITTDRDTLLAAGLLHDVSKLVEYQPDGAGGAETSAMGKLIQHAAYGAHKAWEKGVPDEIVHVIISHTRNSNKPPRTLEGLIVHYVDYLDTDALLFDAGAKLDLHKHW
jgi:putative nucleotidyltransferase with HDIG domain